MSAACSSACGYCGRCTAAWEADDERDDSPAPAREVCDWCGGTGDKVQEAPNGMDLVVPCGECDGTGYLEVSE